MITPERIAEIKARAERATKGPWEAERDGDRVYVVAPSQHYFTGCYAVLQAREPEADFEANVLFAAHARQDIPDLLGDLDAAQEQLESKDRFIQMHRSDLAEMEGIAKQAQERERALREALGRAAAVMKYYATPHWQEAEAALQETGE